MNRPVYQHLVRLALGVFMGFALSRLGFGDFAQVHAMLTLADLRLMFAFAGAVALSAVGFRLIARGQTLPRKAINRSVVVGAALFGVGWALTGTCPAIAPVQLGEGRLVAVITLAGIVIGIWLCSFLQRAGVVRGAGSACADG